MENVYPSCHVPYCGCVGYGFVPVQTLDDVYSVEKSLCQGTIFPELDLNICEYGKVCKKVGDYRDE